MEVLEHRKIRKEREKLAIFDMDWTLIKPKEGRRFPKNAEDWQWLRASVPGVVRGYAKKGYRIVILTDQSKDWKVDTVRSVLGGLDVPAVAIVAFDKGLQKPGVDGFMKVFGGKGYKLGESVYVGDAAGREGDWAGVDKEVAERLGVGRFMVPEEAFPLEVKGVDIGLLVGEEGKREREVVIMVGYPGSGKTTLAKQFEETGRYFRVDGDKFGTSAKMLQEGELGLAGGLSVVFDSTNGTREKRKGFIEFARRHGLGVRCVWVDRGIDEAMEQERERVWRTKAKKIPEVVFYTYRKRFEEPLEEEGCRVVRVE